MSAPRAPTFCCGCTSAKIVTSPSASSSVSSTITTASAPSGIGAPVEISMHCPSPHGDGRDLSGVERPDFRQRARMRVATRRCVSTRAHGIAVHAGARERRHIRPRDDVARRARGRSAVGSGSSRCDRSARRSCRESRARLRAKSRRRTAASWSCAMSSRGRARARGGPSSGKAAACSSPSRTAFSDPGSETMIFPCAVPAHARLIIADGPISW